MVDSPGQRIRGKVDPFRKALDPMLARITTNNGVELFREHLKDAIALRMRYTLYSPIAIDDKCISKIKSYSKHNLNFSFIRCSLKYYCDQKPHKIEQLDTTCASCKSKDYHKSLQHAKEDCLECSKYYIGKIKKQGFISNDQNMMRKCEAMENAVSFVCRYIYALHEGYIPSTLKQSVYDSIIKNYPSIVNYYTYDVAKDTYRLTTSKVLYGSLPLEIATELFCSTFVFYR